MARGKKGRTNNGKKGRTNNGKKMVSPKDKMLPPKDKMVAHAFIYAAIEETDATPDDPDANTLFSIEKCQQGCTGNFRVTVPYDLLVKFIKANKNENGINQLCATSAPCNKCGVVDGRLCFAWFFNAYTPMTTFSFPSLRVTKRNDKQPITKVMKKQR
jgi:hypothetical protein